MRNLKVTILQIPLVWENREANLTFIAELLQKQVIHTDIILLPEMFTSGFSMNVDSFCDSMEGETVNWMMKQASVFNALMVGSVAIREEDAHFNRLLVVSAKGTEATYDKRHLFGLAGESETFSPGKSRLVYEYKDWKINFQICYDLRFPVWSRNTEDYHVLINVANWPEKRINAWDQLLIARAIENQSYTIGVNRVGEDGNGLKYPGHSVVITPLGDVVSKAVDQQCVTTFELDMRELDEVRSKLPFLRDRDKFELL
jgi:omega-amidase